MFTSTTGFALGTSLIAVLLFVGMLAALWLGKRIARIRAKQGAEPQASSGAIGGATFALLGLLIAFTFSGAASRFDARRDLVVQETNAIGTAYLRLDVLAPEARAQLQEKFRRYVDLRAGAFQANTLAQYRENEARAWAMQAEIWSDSVKGAKDVGPPAAQLLLPSLNDAIDITTTRAAALELHPPVAIYLILVMLALFCALLAGLDMTPGQREWLPKVVFSATITLTICLTLDLEHPRMGLIRVTDSDHFLSDLRASMK